MKRVEAFYAAVVLTVFAVIALIYFFTCPAMSWIVYVIACEAGSI